MVIDGTYEIEISTPMGEQIGTCILKSDGKLVNGIYRTPKGDNKFTGTCDGNECPLAISVRGPFGGDIDLTFRVTFTPDGLSGSVRLGPFGNSPVKGVKIN